MFKKNDPLVKSVKKIMEQNELRRRVEAGLCEELGIASRNALPHEHQANYDALLEQRLNEALHPNQQKLDVHEPEKDKLTKKDFEMLRAGKKAMKEEDKSSSDPDFAAPRAAGAPKYKDEIEYKPEQPKTEMPKNPPMPPRRPPNLEETLKQLDEIGDTKAGKETLKRYVKKASDDARARARVAGTEGPESERGKKLDYKSRDRVRYIGKAAEKLAKEEVEQIDEEKATPAQQKKIEKIMGEFKRRKLHSGSKKGPKVTDRKQAIAIALNQAGLSKSKDSSND